MILSQALIIDANMCSLSTAEVENINSLNPATIVWIYEFLCQTGYGHLPISLYRVQNVDYN